MSAEPIRIQVLPGQGPKTVEFLRRIDERIKLLEAVAENGVELVERMVIAAEQMPIGPIRAWLGLARRVLADSSSACSGLPEKRKE